MHAPADLPPPAARDEFRVTLLGIGGPAPNMRRFGPGVLVQAAHHTKPDEAGSVVQIAPRTP